MVGFNEQSEQEVAPMGEEIMSNHIQQWFWGSDNKLGSFRVLVSRWRWDFSEDSATAHLVNRTKWIYPN
jgi:hypothetical protein